MRKNRWHFHSKLPSHILIYLRIISLNLSGNLIKFTSISLHQYLKFPKRSNLLSLTAINLTYIAVEFLKRRLYILHCFFAFVKSGESLHFKFKKINLSFKSLFCISQVLYCDIHLTESIILSFHQIFSFDLKFLN